MRGSLCTYVCGVVKRSLRDDMTRSRRGEFTTVCVSESVIWST